MAKEKKLTGLQEIFCREYIKDFNAMRSAKAAGYSGDNHDVIGYQQLQKPIIQARIKELLAPKLKSLDISSQRILKELAKIAFSNMGDLAEWTDSGVDFKHSKNLTRSQKAAIKEVSQEMNEHGGKLSIKQHDKLKALELLGKYQSLFNERVDIKGEMSFAHLVVESMKVPEESN